VDKAVSEHTARFPIYRRSRAAEYAANLATFSSVGRVGIISVGRRRMSGPERLALGQLQPPPAALSAGRRDSRNPRIQRNTKWAAPQRPTTQEGRCEIRHLRRSSLFCRTAKFLRRTAKKWSVEQGKNPRLAAYQGKNRGNRLTQIKEAEPELGKMGPTCGQETTHDPDRRR
jgi:hypothetical protein